MKLSRDVIPATLLNALDKAGLMAHEGAVQSRQALLLRYLGSVSISEQGMTHHSFEDLEAK